MRMAEHDGRVDALLREFDRVVVELASLGVDVTALREEAPASGLVTVVKVRLESLKRALDSGWMRDARWEFDRVWSAIEKLEAGGAARGQNGRPS